MLPTRQLAAALVALALLPSMTTRAQTPAAPPPLIPYGLPIGLEVAKRVVAGAVAEAQKNGWKMAVAVVDPGGYLVYFERINDTQLGSPDLAIEKARTAALFRRPTKVFQDQLAAGGEGLRILALRGVTPVEGGVPIVVDGKLIGAVGASGGTAAQDGQVATAGAASLAK